MPREIQLEVESLLERHPGMTKTELAKLLGISEATLRAYCENKWTVLDRAVMERMADIFQFDDVTSLVTTRENPFFEPFKSDKSSNYLYLMRPDAGKLEMGRAVALRDYKAIGHLGELLQDRVPGIHPWQDIATTPEKFEESLRKNCIVVGSPVVNEASEMAICRAFDVRPFDPSEIGRLPFTFRVPGKAPRPSSIIEESLDGKQGIWLRENGELVEADSWPREEFRKLRIPRGRDCAILLVWNHQLADEAGCSRKLIVLSGSRGVGTEAAAKALVWQYRDFEPKGSEPVWGILEALYRKASLVEHRDNYASYWRYREGGRCPVEFTKRRD